MLRSRLQVVSRLLFVLLAVILPIQSSFAQSQAENHGPALYSAADILVGYMASDFPALTEKTKKTAIVNFSISENLPGSLRNYLIKKIETAAKDYTQGPLVLMQCVECLSLQAVSKGDEVFISKGITDKKQLEALMNRLGIRNYIDAHLTYTGTELIFQASLVEADQKVSWSGEYKAQYRQQDSTPWILGLTGQGVFFTKKGFPTPMAVRIFTGQKIHGLGNVGVAATIFGKTDELDTINELTGFFELNHNEFFGHYWSHLTLLYGVDLGVTDFNSFLQMNVEAGVRLRMGRYFHLRLAGKFNSHISKPNSDKPVFNPKGESIIKANENLPPAIIFGVGVDIL